MHHRKSARARAGLFGAGCCLGLLWTTAPVRAVNVGVDAVHGFSSSGILASGSEYDTFRAALAAAGHTLVPLTTFSVGELSGVSAIIVKMPYSQNAAPYLPGQMNQIRSFAETSVFVSDSSMWTDADVGSDRPIGFGNNQLLLQNILGYITSTQGALFIGEDGTGFDVANMNALVAPYGVQYAVAPTDLTGRTVTGFVAHPVTSGVTSLGVDFHLPLTITAPATDLTTGTGQDNILAVSTPEPGVGLVAAGLLALFARRRRA